jgi:hypothetical protein
VGIVDPRRLPSTGAAAIATGEVLAGFCVIALVVAWVAYCVDWRDVTTIKDQALQRATDKWRSASATGKSDKGAAAASAAADASRPQSS